MIQIEIVNFLGSEHNNLMKSSPLVAQGLESAV